MRISNRLYKLNLFFAKAVIISIVVVMGIIAYFNYNLPDKYLVETGRTLNFNNLSAISCVQNTSNRGFGKAELVSDIKNQTQTIDIKLFGIFPIKTARVEEINDTVVCLGGVPFGIKIYTDGVLVISTEAISTDNGNVNPSKSAGIREGDFILSINNIPVASNEDVREIITKSNGKQMSIKYRREEKLFDTEITPAKSNQDDLFKVGFWVRDSTAGIGTLSFYNPTTLSFAGLGHAVNDVESGALMTVKSGEVCGVTINSIIKGTHGKPGQLGGYFNSSAASGEITLNNQTGLYGRLNKPLNKAEYIGLGLKQEVKIGKAYIICTLDDMVPTKYEIEICSIDYNAAQQTKNMIIKVTDEKLIEKTGGIIQGMSGSPILQNDKLVGAVTHVFVNSPTKGYAIFAENMYNYIK